MMRRRSGRKSHKTHELTLIIMSLSRSRKQGRYLFSWLFLSLHSLTPNLSQSVSQLQEAEEEFLWETLDRHTRSRDSMNQSESKSDRLSRMDQKLCDR